ncbi:MAG: hypothetical protein NVS1B3_03580 [Candidatus Dormibacteraceae bacterium]
MRTVVLKLGATALTIATTVVSAAYVTAHLKNPAAPLQPAVIKAADGGVMLGPSVQPGTVQPVTSTYAS